jgi:hypothetical protein
MASQVTTLRTQTPYRTRQVDMRARLPGEGPTARENGLAVTRRKCLQGVCVERRGRDSNPRYVLRYMAFPVTHMVGSSYVWHVPKGMLTNALRQVYSVNQHSPAFRKLFSKSEVNLAVRQFVNRTCREADSRSFV